MGLVDYSDSETSDNEQQPSPPTKATVTSKAKPAFSKVVDRSNPGKIKVSLPQTALKENATSEEPPTKRVKTSNGGAFGGFNSFLPAPKRATQPANTSLGGGSQATKGEPKARFSFKTGAEPAFDRGGGEGVYESQGEPTQSTSTDAEESQSQEPAQEVKLVGKPLMFKPLSVSRKPAKKKTASTPKVQAAAPVPPPITPEPAAQKPARPKVSLFSMSVEAESFSSDASSSKEYRPMIYEGGKGETDEDRNDESQDLQASYEDYTPTASQNPPPPAVPTPPVSQSLDDIAGDLNLSAAERRQLFGRQKGGRAANVINFNMDKEYLHNEELRAAGEQVVHNPVRSIAPGKHSLKQLVNAAQQQKDALEESFAKGKNNRAEASSRYGW